MSGDSTADSLRERLSVAWGEGYTTSMSSDCKTGCIDTGVEAVVNVEVVDSAVFWEVMDFINSSWLVRFSDCWRRILSKVLILCACVACIVIRLVIRALDSWIRSSAACIREVDEMVMSLLGYYCFSQSKAYQQTTLESCPITPSDGSNPSDEIPHGLPTPS